MDGTVGGVSPAEGAYLMHLSRIRRAILDPAEMHRSGFHTRIATLMDAIPVSSSGAEAFIRMPQCSVDNAGIDGASSPENQVLREAAGAFDRQMRWHSTRSAHNINQPVLLAAAAVHAVTSLYNPNTLWDLVSGSFQDYERQVIAHLARLVGWTQAEVDGVATFGGKAGLIYAIKAGINRAFPTANSTGFPHPAPIVLTSDETHYSVESAAALLGIGTQAVFRIPTDGAVMDPQRLREVILEVAQTGRRVATVVLSGGNTLDGSVDPFDACIDVIEEQFQGQRPWIYADLALGWPWLYFVDYDSEQNPLGLEPRCLTHIRTLTERMRGVERVDSFGVDFHKLGFAPYSSAFFVTRWRAELRGVFGATAHAQDFEYGQNFVQHHTIEHSRSGEGVLAAWAALKIIGADGFRSYLAHMHDLTLQLRAQMKHLGFTVLNPDSPSLATLVIPQLPCTPGIHRGSLDAWVEHIFREATGLNAGADTSLAIGYVPSYRRPGEKSGQAALRLYLCNPHLDQNALDGLLADLIQLMHRAELSFIDQRPQFVHTPK